MFPFAFEWVSDASHYIFMGPFYTVLILLFVIMNLCAIGATMDWLCKKKDGHGEHGHGEHH